MFCNVKYYINYIKYYSYIKLFKFADYQTVFYDI